MLFVLQKLIARRGKHVDDQPEFSQALNTTYRTSLTPHSESHDEYNEHMMQYKKMKVPSINSGRRSREVVGKEGLDAYPLDAMEKIKSTTPQLS